MLYAIVIFCKYKETISVDELHFKKWIIFMDEKSLQDDFWVDGFVVINKKMCDELWNSIIIDKKTKKS